MARDASKSISAIQKMQPKEKVQTYPGCGAGYHPSGRRSCSVYKVTATRVKESDILPKSAVKGETIRPSHNPIHPQEPYASMLNKWVKRGLQGLTYWTSDKTHCWTSINNPHPHHLDSSPDLGVCMLDWYWVIHDCYPCSIFSFCCV